MAEDNLGAAAGLANLRAGAIQDVDVEVYAILGQPTMLVSQLLKIGRGAIIELDQSTSDPVEIRVNQQLIAYGEIVTVDDNLGVTITGIVKKQVV
ncbi:MAG: Flagellar motor switch protein FliN [Alphaproteobacteria bacterium MarineAlpha10_Bin3]|nr:MAG: Flagellar motor switch protein FliN [Alphaproteobacteria bacterium MarineAlpha10_Bin3]PPR68353.1 MAG: Flagellar motor switch protein FliN [Alphaproteobacteria bacterium MarineAlpha4_Bin1]